MDNTFVGTTETQCNPTSTLYVHTPFLLVRAIITEGENKRKFESFSWSVETEMDPAGLYFFQATGVEHSCPLCSQWFPGWWWSWCKRLFRAKLFKRNENRFLNVSIRWRTYFDSAADMITISPMWVSLSEVTLLRMFRTEIWIASTHMHGNVNSINRRGLLTQCGQLHLPSGAFSSSGSRQTRWYALGQVSHRMISPPCWQTSQ